MESPDGKITVYVCYTHNDIKEGQIYGRLKSVKCFLKVTESLKYTCTPVSINMCFKILKNRVVVLIVHIKKNSSIFWTEFLTGVSKGKMQLLKLKIAVIWAGEQVAIKSTPNAQITPPSK